MYSSISSKVHFKNKSLSPEHRGAGEIDYISQSVKFRKLYLMKFFKNMCKIQALCPLLYT